nr:immunoglobulin heavy chain junction region [Mus musculus]
CTRDDYYGSSYEWFAYW